MELGEKEGFAAAHSHLERGGAAGRSEAVGFLVQLRSHLLGYLATIARLGFTAAAPPEWGRRESEP